MRWQHDTQQSGHGSMMGDGAAVRCSKTRSSMTTHNIQQHDGDTMVSSAVAAVTRHAGISMVIVFIFTLCRRYIV